MSKGSKMAALNMQQGHRTRSQAVATDIVVKQYALPITEAVLLCQ